MVWNSRLHHHSYQITTILPIGRVYCLCNLYNYLCLISHYRSISRLQLYCTFHSIVLLLFCLCWCREKRSQSSLHLNGWLFHLCSLFIKHVYQLMVLSNGVLQETSWAPRSLKSVTALAHYYQRNWPQNSYWLMPVDWQLSTLTGGLNLYVLHTLFKWPLIVLNLTTMLAQLSVPRLPSLCLDTSLHSSLVTLLMQLVPFGILSLIAMAHTTNNYPP